jgi:hypothetical protein
MAEKTKPKKPTPEEFAEYQRGAAAVVMAPPGSFPFEKPEANTDVFDAPLGAIVGTAGLRAQASQSRDPLAAKDARAELSARRAKTRAAAPTRPGQRPSVAQWTEHVRERLSRITEEQRHELLWNSEWYDGLSERAAGIVDELLLEFSEEETRAEEAGAYRRDDLLGESEATARLNAELDDEYGYGDEYLPGTDEYELEAEMEEVEAGYDGDAA